MHPGDVVTLCLHTAVVAWEGESPVPDADADGVDLPSSSAPPNDRSSGDSPTWRLHPFGWVVVGFTCLSLVATATGSERLIGNLAVWHWAALLALLVLNARPAALHRFRLGIEKITSATGSVARWMGWLVFLVSFVNVVARYTGRYVERDIIIGQMMTLAWMTFAFMFLIGMNYGVREGVNPRIDFWWANFSRRRKAWLDFVMHTFFFLPFIIAANRILWPYSRIGLGRKRSGTWPTGWRFWQSWEQHSDADQLPVGPIKAVLLIGFLLFGLQVLAEIIKTGFTIMGREDLADIHEQDAPMRIE